MVAAAAAVEMVVVLQSPNTLTHFKHIKLELHTAAGAGAAATVYGIPALYFLSLSLLILAVGNSTMDTVFKPKLKSAREQERERETTS